MFLKPHLKGTSGFLLAYLVGAVFFTGCQTDIGREEEAPVVSVEVITRGSEILNLLKATATNDSRIDDLVDDFSCGQLEYPVTITVNNQQLTLQQASDVQNVRDIFNASPNDYDFVLFEYPLSFIDDDYEDFVVADQNELDSLIQVCESDYQLTGITCVDIIYPIYLITFDRIKEISNNFELNSDFRLYNSMVGLKDQEFASVLFPIEVSLDDGSLMTIANGTELENLLALVINDDCFVPEVVNLDETILRDLLLADTFIVKIYKENGADRTNEFSSYTLLYNPDGSSETNTGTNTVAGAWGIERDFSTLELDLDFADSGLISEFDNDWDVIGQNDIEVDLRFRGQELTLRRLRSITAVELQTLMSSAGWAVSSYITTSDQTSLFDNRVFTFSPNGELRAAINTLGVEGVWTAVPEAPFELSVNMSFENIPPFDLISKDWRVQNYNDNEIQLVILDVSGLVIETLIFAKL